MKAYPLNLEKRNHVTLYLTPERKQVLKEILDRFPEDLPAVQAIFSVISDVASGSFPSFLPKERRLRARLDAWEEIGEPLRKQHGDKVGINGIRACVWTVYREVLDYLLEHPIQVVGRQLTDRERTAVELSRWEPSPELFEQTIEMLREYIKHPLEEKEAEKTKQ